MNLWPMDKNKENEILIGEHYKKLSSSNVWTGEKYEVLMHEQRKKMKFRFYEEKTERTKF